MRVAVKVVIHSRALGVTRDALELVKKSFTSGWVNRYDDVTADMSFPSNRGGLLYVAGWPGVMLAFVITNVTQAVIARLEEMATAASTLVYETAGQIVARVASPVSPGPTAWNSDCSRDGAADGRQVGSPPSGQPD